MLMLLMMIMMMTTILWGMSEQLKLALIPASACQSESGTTHTH